MKNSGRPRKPQRGCQTEGQDGEDQQKTWMNEGEFENLGSQSGDSKGWPTPPFGPGGCGRIGQILPSA